MEKKSSKGSIPKRSSQQKFQFLGPNTLQISEDDGASRLVGSIVEKGMVDEPSAKPVAPTPAPRPSALPFPIARHRSHGPHWGPMANTKGGGAYVDDDDGGGKISHCDPIVAFANPVQKKEKKGLDFTSWRELVSSDNSSVVNKKEEQKFSSLEFDAFKKDGEATEFVDKGNMSSGTAFVHGDAVTCMEMNAESQVNSHRSPIKTEGGITSCLGIGFVDSIADMKLDSSGKSSCQEMHRSSGNYLSKNTKSTSLLENHTKLQEVSLNGTYEPPTRMLDNTRTVLSEALKNQGRVEIDKQKSSSNDFGSDQGSISLENQIDAENHALLQRMSTDEIAEAQAEIMDRINPALLNMLKQRGQEKLKKQKYLSCDQATKSKPSNLQSENPLTRNGEDFPHVESTSHVMTATRSTLEDRQRLLDGNVQNTGSANSSLWNAWSERVEAVRELRFSFDGTVIKGDFAVVPETGSISGRSGYSADNVTERDFLRTEGDPGAAGYTIKEAVALTRSVVPGQRVLALHLLAAVLDNALCNIHQNQIGRTPGNANKVGRSIDWEAVWAFALGPEPELVLSLRMALDDNHNSVVLACAKVIQCILSCDMNENYFNISEKIAAYENDICIAPVFRSRPDIDVGFLHGGFWKYSAKPSNILPFGDDTVDDETDGKHTIHDDIVVSGQDFAAGLVRMGILPRIRYLLETDPMAALEECLISTLIVIARHSPSCADAIIKCQRLIQTIIIRFTMKDRMEIFPSMIKSVTLLKVLARYDRKNCKEFIENGTFRDMSWHLYRYAVSLDQWVKAGRENCKLASALMVEQLRFWKVCIQFGYCVSYFSEFFPALCLWLNPPTFEKLIENNVLCEFASITKEAYLVLGALARRLPNFYSQTYQSNQIPDFLDDDAESWCWSHVGPMVDLALKWISYKNNPHLSKFFGWTGVPVGFVLEGLSLTPLLWVISAVMQMLSSVLERVIPEDTVFASNGSDGRVPWVPEFIPRVGLEIIKNEFLSFSDMNGSKHGTRAPGSSSFVAELCHLRHQSNNEASLASVCCLLGLVQVIVSVDKLIHLAKSEICNPSSQGYNFSRDDKILEDGIVNQSVDELRSVLTTFTDVVISEWHYVHSIEIFGRGGPAPGVGLGWGASGGGFWSTTVLLAQRDTAFLIQLLEIFQIVCSTDLPAVKEMTFNVETINAVLGACVTIGPRDRVIMEKALDILLQVPVLKYLDFCTRQFLHPSRGIKPFRWEYVEEDYLSFSKNLISHFSDRWSCVKKKKKKCDQETLTKCSTALYTIHEDVDPSRMSSQDDCCTSLVVEWAHQRLPLPMHWFLSPISTIHDNMQAGPLVASNTLNHVQGLTGFHEVAKSGLFFLLGIEGMSSSLSANVCSPVRSVPLIWKLHSLSVILLTGMSVLEEEKSRDVYAALQELYGQLLDELRYAKNSELVLEENSDMLSEKRKKESMEFLMFQSEIHESYSTFIETVVEQFAAISYGDLIFGRQVAIYLYRHVEATVRLSAWNALSNARVLELLPRLEECLAEAEGYLEPVEDNEAILEAYVKSWISGSLDRAVVRGSLAFTLVLHHLSSFIFDCYTTAVLSLRNKLVKSLLRGCSRKQQHEDMMLDLIQHKKPFASGNPELKEGLALQKSRVERRFEILTEACEGNSSLLTLVERLKYSFRKL
ncbi:transcriptional elongation regulator MINIYO [Malania oleifera]|uniref:transcriptional elongation regulator MINIYO n=1 Tax=Malania oleifera TaxID=397392 RepID=UPI0025ADE54D|nr:transcriptional elongation regulator MINIYO [Malania oleifera]